jgi:hypothetical protein
MWRDIHRNANDNRVVRDWTSRRHLHVTLGRLLLFRTGETDIDLLDEIHLHVMFRAPTSSNLGDGQSRFTKRTH